MSLLSEHTHWVLLSAASSDSEDRHIQDIAYGLKCLEDRGIKSSDISLFIDGSDRVKISSIISTGSNNSYSILTSMDFYDFLSKLKSYENIVLFIGGHGSYNGIDAPTPIKPFPLFKAIKSIQDLKKGIIILGQCYAGIFNYMDVDKKENNQAELVEPPLVIIGATNLFLSTSVFCTGIFKNGQLSWLSNIFLTKIFEWFSNPIDIDGDGKFTIMDAYKCAGLISNDTNKAIKGMEFFTPHKISAEIDKLKQDISIHSTKDLSDPLYKILIDELRDKTTIYNNHINIRFNHQESWILNANLARKIEL